MPGNRHRRSEGEGKLGPIEAIFSYRPLALIRRLFGAHIAASSSRVPTHQLVDGVRRFDVLLDARSPLGAGRSARRPVTYLWSTLAMSVWYGMPSSSALA